VDWKASFPIWYLTLAVESTICIMVTAGAARGNDLLSSIALVRELLTENPHHVNVELSLAQQSRYENRSMVEEEQKAHREIVEDLQFRLEQAKNEARQEKVIRLSLEETNAALEQHMAELSARLDAIATTAVPPSKQPETDPGHVEAIKLLETEKSELNSKLSAIQKEVDEAKASANNWMKNCYQAQRQVNELQIQLDTMKKEYRSIQSRQEYLLEGTHTKYDSFQKCLEDSIAARRTANEELRAIKATQPAASVGEQGSCTSEISEWKSKYEEALASTACVEEKAFRLEAEIAVLKQERGASSLSGDLPEEEREAMVTLLNKIAELNELYTKTEKEAKEHTAKEPNSGDKLTPLNTQVGAILDSSKFPLKEKYAALQITVDDYISEFQRIREDIKTAAQLVDAEKEQSETSDRPKTKKRVGNCNEPVLTMERVCL
jgi:hypothetical protein